MPISSQVIGAFDPSDPQRGWLLFQTILIHSSRHNKPRVVQ